MSIREVLRELPTFPDDLPMLDPDEVPEDPIVLLTRWLEDAIESGERQPNAMTVATVDENGVPTTRTLIVKDIDERGLHFSSSAATRKAQHIASGAAVSLHFFWRPLGRTVEIGGPAVPLDRAESDRDWRERPNYRGADNPDWQVWAVHPSRIEFLQATHDRAHIRVEYVREGDTWRHQRLQPSERSTGT